VNIGFGVHLRLLSNLKESTTRTSPIPRGESEKEENEEGAAPPFEVRDKRIRKAGAVWGLREKEALAAGQAARPTIHGSARVV